ncbi:T9SS type A sorting domain-containing protein [Flavobacterium sp. DG1-102-2]|uniref:T9SS type A sorting domain-containing protein n=1 Tax=Flavobacterium sp. DG1-102-2 TaxID=3081663 RepID=UPI0029496269|nr:T9SS type A sorting domain-containing protein [Flavobacterium sp. DG1-102-2]MDV6168447.1 T9SS type A sorting domain-containing protein [Flavobacterium sp. DG1-102-2]
MKRKLLFALLAAPCFYATAQTTNIPDPIFEQLLIDKEIDTDGIINGQIDTADALAVTDLVITYEDNINFNFISDLTGIEAFTNLESLIVNFTEAGELDVSTMIHLKHLDCVDNMLSSIDVSNNPLLEYLDISTGGDVGPMNYISEIDLSHNPNIKMILASGGVGRINLKNGNNNPDMHINISGFYDGMGPEPDIYTCIEVDNAEAAQNNQAPYSDWTIAHVYATYSLVTDCSLGTEDFDAAKASVYPNPTSDILYFQTNDGTIINKIIVFDISGRIVKEYGNISDSFSISDLQAGAYIVKLASEKEIFTQRVIKK